MAAHFGLDISSTTIKVVEARKQKNGFELLAFGEIKAPASYLSFNPKDYRLIAKDIAKLISDSKISSKETYINIPESQVYTRVIQLPRLSAKELETAVKFESEQYIPVPLNEVYLEYEVLSSPPAEMKDGKMEVLLVAAKKKIVEVLVEITQMAGLTPLVVETSLVSALRSLKGQLKDYSFLVDIGNTTTDIAIIQDSKLKQTSSLSIAGGALTRSISQNLSLSNKQAEKYKHAYGLETKYLEGKIASSMSEPINNILNHIIKNIRFARSLGGESRVEQIVLSGGTSLLPNLSYFLVDKLNLEVNLANPLQDCINNNLPQSLTYNAPRFCSVIGLAIRE